MIATTLALCAIALAFRNDIRGRYWAHRASQSNDLSERAYYLNLLIAAGESGAWGVGALARDSRVQNRELAALVLQTRRSPWAREILFRLLVDAEPSVRDLAILALATIRDPGAIDPLMAMYSSDDSEAALRARTACAGLQRMGGFPALQALSRLVEVNASAAARGALVDALLDVGGTAAVADLLKFLDDHRECSLPSFEERMAMEVLRGAGSEQLGFFSAQPDASASQPTQVTTVAERAARALGEITGRKPPFASAGSEAERRAAIEEWLTWRP
ncbi:MAG: HEAT repeat domain-containing protein [Planctomycetia bacterium]|nr:MAG: HEAT repeat domain-containing protein [Planctomycetia bacterium]